MNHLIYGVCRFARSHMFVNLQHLLGEQLSVLCPLYRLHWRPQHLHRVLLQNSLFTQFHPTVQSCLATKRQQNTVWTLAFYDLQSIFS